MVKVCVIQSDNRMTLDYLLKTRKVNEMFCNYLNFEYEFIEIKNDYYSPLHPATKKIHVVHDFIQSDKYDILVFLDSDAWIQNGNWLKDIIHHLVKDNEKHGCFSRDPYVKKNTFINSGSFILKINDYTREMYKHIIHDLIQKKFDNVKPYYDQPYISDYVFNHKENFMIFVPDIMNTPIGKVLRHNWPKNEKMHEDLNKLMLLKKEEMDATPFQIKLYYDHKAFPNIKENGNEYFTEPDVDLEDNYIQESFQNERGYAYLKQKDDYIIRFLNQMSYFLILILSLLLMYCVFIYYKPKTKYFTCDKQRSTKSRKRHT